MASRKGKRGFGERDFFVYRDEVELLDLPAFHSSIESALPLHGELPDENMARNFWDHLIEEHLGIEQYLRLHSRANIDPNLVAEHTFIDKRWKEYKLEDLIEILTEIANGLPPERIYTRIEENSTATYRFKNKLWIFHLSHEPSLYISTHNQSLNGIIRKGFATQNPSNQLIDFYADSANIFLNHFNKNLKPLL